MNNKIKKELKEMAAKELVVRANDLRKELFLLRMKKVSSPEKNTSLARTLRKSLACTLTLLRQRELNGER